LTAALVLLAPPAGAQSSPAQDYPSRPVTLVVPYPAGGGLDALARVLGQKLADRLGKPVVVENRTGAGTVIGAASVAKAAPDGYTIMLGTSTPFAITATLNKSLPYDPAKDFAPIALVSNAPFLLLVHPSQPVHSVADLVALAKSKPGQLSYGSAGPGSPQNLSFELLKTLTGINVVHVPYRGDGPRSPIWLPVTSRPCSASRPRSCRCSRTARCAPSACRPRRACRSRPRSRRSRRRACPDSTSPPGR